MEEKRTKDQGIPMLRLLGVEKKPAKDSEKEQLLRMEESEESVMYWKPSKHKYVISYTAGRSRKSKVENQPLELAMW